VLGKDIFTDRHYEDVFSNEHMFEVPHLIENDYFLISIEDDEYVTLLGKYNEGNG